MRFFPIFIISISTAIAVPYLVDETPSTDALLNDGYSQADGTVPEPLVGLYPDQAVAQYNPDGPIDDIQNPAADQFIAVNDVLSQADYILPDGANSEMGNEIIAFDPVAKVLDQMGQSNRKDVFWSSSCKETSGICCTEDVKPAPSPNNFKAVRVQSCATSTQ